MTNVAIVLSAGNYAGELSKLPACQADSNAIIEMLKCKQRFEHILVSHDENTTAVNEKVFSFLKSFEGKDVEEVLFYFSGHGEYHEDEFYFLMRDFRSSKRRQTSFINSELDDAVRAIKPRVYAKIVDACHSGISYVKNSESIKGYLEKSKPPLKDLYFLFSSQYDQSSWQGEHLSDFTQSIINAVRNHEADTLKYKDVINYVVDDFEVLGGQTPFFVNQGSFTDVFCEITDELRSKLSEMIASTGDLVSPKGDDNVSLSMADMVRKEAEKYCSKEEAFEIIASLPDRFAVTEADEEFEDIYRYIIHTGKIETLPSREAIGSVLNVKRESETYFAEPIIEAEQYQKRVPKGQGLAALGASIRALQGVPMEDFVMVPATRNVVKGYRNTVDMPLEVVLIGAVSDLPNLPEAWCFVAPIISRTNIRMFYAYASYEAVNWDTKKISNKVEWQSVDSPLKDDDALNASVRQICMGFVSFVQDPVKAKYKVT